MEPSKHFASLNRLRFFFRRCSDGDYVQVVIDPQLVDSTGSSDPNDVAILCGSSLAEQSRSYFSRRNVLIILFHSSSNYAAGKGFKGRYQFQEKLVSDGEGLPESECDVQFLSISSSTKSTSSGRFYSPYHPSKYPSNTVCAYHFMGKFDEKVRVVFQKIAFGNVDLRLANNLLCKLFISPPPRANIV